VGERGGGDGERWGREVEGRMAVGAVVPQLQHGLLDDAGGDGQQLGELADLAYDLPARERAGGGL